MRCTNCWDGPPVVRDLCRRCLACEISRGTPGGRFERLRAPWFVRGIVRLWDRIRS